MVIYCLDVKDYKRLMERLSREIFYHNARNKRKMLKELINKKQRMMVVTNVFGIKIDIVNIKIIMHTNESKMMLNYTQKNK